MTPPVDEEEENEESRLFEAQARKTLEDRGCPPCYPSGLDIPLRNPPEKYRAIIQYWESFPSTDDVVLCAELSDWRKFYTAQRRDRAQWRNKLFSKFVDEVRERRRRHGLGGDANLLFDLEQQERLGNWLEYQNYHLKRFERFKKKRDELKKELDNSQKKIDGADIPDSARATKYLEALQQMLENAKRDLERHKVLLHWIEEERQTMVIGYSASIEEDYGYQDTVPKAVRRASTRHRRTRRQEASPVLGKVCVSKSTPRKRDTRTQQPKSPEFEGAFQDSDTIPQNSTSQAPKLPKRQGTRARHAEEGAPLHQCRAQKASKASRFTDTSATSLSRKNTNNAGLIRSRDLIRSRRRPASERPLAERPQPALKGVKTWSGRISKPPTRWAPD